MCWGSCILTYLRSASCKNGKAIYIPFFIFIFLVSVGRRKSTFYCLRHPCSPSQKGTSLSAYGRRTDYGCEWWVRSSLRADLVLPRDLHRSHSLPGAVPSRALCSPVALSPATFCPWKGRGGGAGVHGSRGSPSGISSCMRWKRCLGHGCCRREQSHTPQQHSAVSHHVFPAGCSGVFPTRPGARRADPGTPPPGALKRPAQGPLSEGHGPGSGHSASVPAFPGDLPLLGGAR